MEINSTLQEAFSLTPDWGFGHPVRMYPWAERANTALRARGWSKAELARRSGANKQELYKWLQGLVAQPRGDSLGRMARTLGVNEYWLLTGRGPRVSAAPLVGFVSAGEEFYPIDDLAQGAGLDDVPLDLDAADPIAIRVRGSSMSPVYRNGDDLFCARVRGLDIERAVGRDCVVQTKEGAGYVKQLRRNRDGRYVLRSYNPAFEDIEGIEIEWVAPIVFIRRAF